MGMEVMVMVMEAVDAEDAVAMEAKDNFKLVVRYLLAREGVLAPGRPTLLTHA